MSIPILQSLTVNSRRSDVMHTSRSSVQVDDTQHSPLTSASAHHISTPGWLKSEVITGVSQQLLIALLGADWIHSHVTMVDLIQSFFSYRQINKYWLILIIGEKFVLFDKYIQKCTTTQAVYKPAVYTCGIASRICFHFNSVNQHHNNENSQKKKQRQIITEESCSLDIISYTLCDLWPDLQNNFLQTLANWKDVAFLQKNEQTFSVSVISKWWQQWKEWKAILCIRLKKEELWVFVLRSRSHSLQRLHVAF